MGVGSGRANKFTNIPKSVVSTVYWGSRLNRVDFSEPGNSLPYNSYHKYFASICIAVIVINNVYFDKTG